MNIKNSFKEEANPSQAVDYSIKEDKVSSNKHDQLCANMFSDQELLQSPFGSVKSILLNKTTGGMSGLFVNQGSQKQHPQAQSFTEREDRPFHHHFSKTFLKESDNGLSNNSPNTSNQFVKNTSQMNLNSVKSGQGFLLKSPITPQMANNQNAHMGEFHLGYETDSNNIKSNHLPNLQIYDQLYNMKNSAYFQLNDNQHQNKGFIQEQTHIKGIKSQPDILLSPEIIKDRKPSQQTQTKHKFFHIRQVSQDTGFFKGFSSVRHSIQNLDHHNNLSSPIISNQIKKKQDFRSISDKKDEKVKQICQLQDYSTNLPLLKLNILVILNQISSTYEKDGRVSYNLCILVQKLIGKLSKQDNMYGEQMKTFFNIIQQMIICEEQTIISRIKQFQSLKRKKQTISNIPAYFQCVQILSEEIDYLNHQYEQMLQQMRNEKEKILEENFSLRDKFQVQQTEAAKNSQQIEKSYQQKLNESHKQIEQLIQQQEEQFKEIASLRESVRQSKLETEKQMRNNNNLNYSLQQQQQKINELTDQINQHVTEIQSKEQQVNSYHQRVEQHSIQLGQLTPRPKFDGFFKVLDQGADFSLSFSVDDKGLSTQEKIDYIQYKIQEKFIDPQYREEDKKKSNTKNKSATRLKQSLANSKDPKGTPPKTRNPNRKNSNLKQSNSINITQGVISTNIPQKNPQELFIKATNEIKKRIKQKNQMKKQGILGADQIDILTLGPINLNSISSMSNTINQNFRNEQKLSNFSRSMRNITRKPSNIFSVQRSNSRATLASIDSIEIGDKGNKNKKPQNNSQTQIEQTPNINDDGLPPFKRGSKGRASTYLSKKKTVVFEENR